MALGLAPHFLLFLWFSGVNQFVHPSSEAGSGLDEVEAYEDDPLTLPLQYAQYTPQLRALSLPPAHADPLQDEPLLLRRQYRLEDFLWTGSGDGPHPSETDGGLAWEDNGGGYQLGGTSTPGPKSYIRVTKTMTLYRTVLTTIYPVEMTPVVTISASDVVVSPTPVSPSPGSSWGVPGFYSEEEYSATADSAPVMWIPTPTFSPTGPPEATAMPPMFLPSSTTPEPTQDLDLGTVSLDPLYWIQTSIKANSSVFQDKPRVFHQAMQKGLARVYAKAFKRHLLSTLGVLQQQQQQSQRRRRRKRRSSFSPADDPGDLPQLRWMYVAQSQMSPSQLKQLATAAMNVTVKILNVTSASDSSTPPRVDLRYVVLAEGTPVPAFSAVRELDLVTKKEMEDTLGYPIWEKKAEALVAGPPPEQMTRNEHLQGQTSPWLIVAITTLCLLVILLALIGFMVWKWKHNRLGDAVQHMQTGGGAPRPQSGTQARKKTHSVHTAARGARGERHVQGEGDDDDDEASRRSEIDEEGVINPAFLGTPKRTTRGETLDPSPKSSPARQSLLSARARARTATQRISEVLTRLPSSSGSRKTKVVKASIEGAPSPDSPHRLKYRKEVDWNSPSSSEELRGGNRRKPGGPVMLTSSEGSADWKELLGEPKPRLPPGGRRRSPTRQGGRTSGGGAQQQQAGSKEVLRRKRKKAKVAEEANLKTDFDGEEDDEDDEDEDEEERVPTPPLTSTSRGKDAISLGNLDIFHDSAVAQTPSEYARKLVPWKRPGSAVGAAAGQSGGTGGNLQPYFLPSSDRPKSRIQTIDEIPSFDQLDRDLSERSESPVAQKSPGGGSPVDTKEQGVQTPTRISKTASHKQRAAAKPRKNWKGSPGGGGPEAGSVISTESEEIVEVHHVGGHLPEEENPLGRMRKRFHQFLDDAFNVMVSGGRGTSADDPGGGAASAAAPDFDIPPPQACSSTRKRGGGGGRQGETQSAKVSICHEVVETETEWRPWTSHVIREETLQKLKRGGRPKSAAVPAQVIGPPKRAWTASSERRTHSAKSSKGSRVTSGGNPPQGEVKEEEEEEHEPDPESSVRAAAAQRPPKPILKTNSSLTADPPSSSSLSSVILSPAFIFPQYPTYPDIRVGLGSSPRDPQISSSSSGDTIQSQQGGGAGGAVVTHPSPPPPPSLPPTDPAVPLIQAIKNEMKKFEKDSPPPN